MNSVESSNPQLNSVQTLEKMSAYEKSREERIKANLERMQKLGIADLSLKLKSLTSPPKRTKRAYTKRDFPLPPVFPPSESRRRSSRLQNSTPVSYSEAVMKKKSGAVEDEYVMLEEGSKPEVYTEEHEKLLGSTEKSWTLFVDGYGKDGKRIYDPIKGKTCHQCRQKTLGYRTHCSQCEMVQGQFCGDCLYMRYGEHVLEAIENPNWICPPCRGICNCSLCRHGKGWAPTGTLYKRISSLGYKSVAHYLIQTQRAQKNTEEKNSVTINQATAKRSLPFSEMETPAERDTLHDELKSNEEKQLPNSTTLPDKENGLEFKVKEEEEMLHHDNNKITVQRCTKLERKRALVFESSPESIGARLRRRQKNREEGNAEWTDAHEKSCDVEQLVNNMLTDQEVKRENETCVNRNEYANNGVALLESNLIVDEKTECDMLTDQEVKIENETRVNEDEYANNGDTVLESNLTVDKKTECANNGDIVLESNLTVNKKMKSDTEPNSDSIGGRLRKRRRMNKE